MLAEENHILDDLLEHVEYEMNCKGNMSSEPSDIQPGTINGLSTASYQTRTDVKSISREVHICPSKTGHSPAEFQSEDKVILDAFRMDDYLLDSWGPYHQDSDFAVPELKPAVLKVPSIPISADNIKECLEVLPGPNNSQLGVNDRNASDKLPVISDDGWKRQTKENLKAIGDIVLGLPRKIPMSNSPAGDTVHKPAMASEPDLSEMEMDVDLMNFVDADVQQTEQVCRIRDPIPEGFSKVEVPKLAPHNYASAGPTVPRDELISKALQDFRLCELWNTQASECETKMSWEPFKFDTTKINLEAPTKDDPICLSKFISPPMDVVQSSQLLFKEPGLRILDEDEFSDDELEEDDQLAELTSKSPEPQIPQKRPVIDDLLADLPLNKAWSSSDRDFGQPELGTVQLQVPFGGGFSTAKALDSFLDLRGGKFKRINSHPRPLSVLEIADDPIQTQTQDNRVVQACQSLDQARHSSKGTMSIVQVPATPVKRNAGEQEANKVLEVKPLTWKRSIMVKTGLLKTHRSLITFLERQGGSQLEIIYREMGSDHIPSKKVREQPELILNPMSCLIFTNIQALSQRSLPGQNPTSSGNLVRNRVQTLAHDYDSVFIIATVPSPTGGFSQSHVDSMSVFTGYCASFKPVSVIPIWAIPASDPVKVEETTHAWTWSCISQHAYPTSIQQQSSVSLKPVPATLIHDETSWEHFLRRAGMNPMAAQVVLGMLPRSSTPRPGQVEETWGLSRLVSMSASERIDMFEAVIGRRAIERVNSVLDGEWVER